jgi:SAM-dependent methyltransferase
VTQVDPRWYEGFFGHEWLDYVALPSDPAQTIREVDFMVEALGLEPGSRILDLACGRGRHAVELARRGFGVTGVDLSAPSLELAREAAAAAGVDVELVESDMREIGFDAEFDGVINVFSSFGYFERQDDDERVLAGVARALRPGGRFLLDTLNPLELVRRFREREWREFDDGTVFLQQRAYDQLTGRIDAIWTFIRSDGSRSEIRHSMRVYTPAELVTLLRATGLVVERTWGDFAGAELGAGPRVILLSRRLA